MAKYATNVSGAVLLPSSIQVTESISGSVVPLAMFVLSFRKYLTSNILPMLHESPRTPISQQSANGMIISELPCYVMILYLSFMLYFQVLSLMFLCLVFV